MISGLWHGAAWDFILWGAIHGAIIVFERKIVDFFPILTLKDKRIRIEIKYLFAWIWVVITVGIAWVFFRSETLSDAVSYIQLLFLVTGHHFSIMNLSFLLLL